jgi:hypothetical protein
MHEGISKNFRTDNEINNNEHSLRSNTKCYGGKTRYTDSQNSDTTASSGREFCHLQFSLHAASPETFGYTLVYGKIISHWAIYLPVLYFATTEFYIE